MEEQTNVIICIAGVVIFLAIVQFIIKHFFPKTWKKYFDD